MFCSILTPYKGDKVKANVFFVHATLLVMEIQDMPLKPPGSYVCCVLGWSDFLEKIIGTCHALPNSFSAPIQKFHFLVLLFNMVQGLSKF